MTVLREVAASIAAIVGRPDLVKLGARPGNPTDPAFICANNRRLVEGTDWNPRFDLESGPGDTVAWWQQRHAHQT